MDFVKNMHAKLGVKAIPADIGDGGAAFAGFMHFALGESDQALKLFQQFRNEHPDFKPNGANAARYIDWLIVNHWGGTIGVAQTKEAA